MYHALGEVRERSGFSLGGWRTFPGDSVFPDGYSFAFF
jgi:hypothetical protein